MGKSRRIRTALYFIFLAIVAVPLTSQSGNEFLWTSYTKLDHVRSIGFSPQDHIIWCATTGGLLRFDADSGSYEGWTHVEGVISNNLLTVSINDAGHVWIGSEGDGVCRYNPSDSSWVYYTADFREAVGTVHEIIFNEEEIWFGTKENGIQTLIEGSDPGDYLDDAWMSYTVRNGLSDNMVRALFITDAGDWWVGTDEGVSVLSHETDEWSYFTTENSVLRHNQVNAIAQDRLGRIWIATRSGLNRYEQGKMIAFSGPSRNMRAIAFDDTFAVIPTNSAIYRYWNGGREVLSQSDWDCYDVMRDHNNNFWFAVDGVGLVRWDSESDEWTEFPINAPEYGSFFHIAIDKNRDAWLTTGRRPGNPEARGVVKLDTESGIWKTFHRDNSMLPGNNCTGVVVDSQNRKFIGNYNGPGGLTLISSDETEWRVFDATTSGISNSANLEMHLDDQENLWMISYTAGIDVLQISGNDTNWVSFTGNEPNGGLSDTEDAATIALSSYNGGMLFMYRRLETIDFLDYNNTLGYKYDDQWEGLPFPMGTMPEDIGFITTDANNEIWIGTQNGIAAFSGSDISEWSIDEKWENSTNLLGVTVNHILVDQDNNKWFSTPENGLHYFIDRPGEKEWYHFTHENSMLVSNEVYWTAEDKDPATGNLIIWVATVQGVSRVEVQPQDGGGEISSSSAYAYPNPFDARKGHYRITLVGLPTKSVVNIFNVAGDVVRDWSFKFTGLENGELTWDLKNNSGARVAPGIYFFTATEINEPTVTGKFAILR
ncbi:MAG: hypothetical protein B6244_00335 [Candidatus Cloacimonetes bacterium 4572_55]|nr:MAG: hypothetical protein B6244_00335 [Candidatus Cloacimonetes bacterium 4572_55]